MQLRYVFSETATGLRRNVSMTVALVVTIFVSLTLVGVGLLLNAQAHRAEAYWGSKLQITVFLCNANSRTPHLCDGDVTDPQKQAIEQVLKTSPQVKGYQYREQAGGVRRAEEGLPVAERDRPRDLLLRPGLGHERVLLG